MSRHTSNNLTTIRCNAPQSAGSELTCLSSFITASIQRVAREQAKIAGWRYLPAWTVTKNDSPRRMYDLCPDHGVVAEEVRKNRPAQRREEAHARRVTREADQAERARKRQKRREAKAAEKIARAERKVLRAERKRLGLRPVNDPRPIPEPHYSSISTDEEQAIDRAFAEEIANASTGEFADDGSWRSVEDPSVQAEVAPSSDYANMIDRLGTCDGEHPAPVCGNLQCWQTRTPADPTVAAAEGFAFTTGGEPISHTVTLLPPYVDRPAIKLAANECPSAAVGEPCGFGVNGGECYACELARKQRAAGWTPTTPMTPAEIHEAYHDVFPPPSETPPAPPKAPRQPRAARTGRSVLDVVEGLLRARSGSLSVAELVSLAAGSLPTQSKTPATIVSRDLALDIKAHGEASRFVRTAPGRFALRAWVALEIEPGKTP